LGLYFITNLISGLSSNFDIPGRGIIRKFRKFVIPGVYRKNSIPGVYVATSPIPFIGVIGFYLDILGVYPQINPEMNPQINVVLFNLVDKPPVFGRTLMTRGCFGTLRLAAARPI